MTSYILMRKMVSNAAFFFSLSSHCNLRGIGGPSKIGDEMTLERNITEIIVAELKGLGIQLKALIEYFIRN